ncbi:peptidase S8 [Alishewanella sp. WH16-1]|uniref:S8 family serine peptidase n=1 Tax=Alishewanella sp. WH16-1 TaxID=1651088 RepID=UPI00070B5A0E|nr:S8 family serine peptidase [Alishewanella sp. WH16-1]KRS22322.1 peptidase S8 [Alishewanella sp. WH16-1]
MKKTLVAALFLAGLPAVSPGQVVRPPELPPPLVDTLKQPTGELLRQTEQLQQQLAEQRLREQLAALATLPDPLQLPAVQDILTLSGEPLWREVEVEQGFRAIEREWLLLLTADEWQALLQRWPDLAGYLQRQQPLPALQLTLVTLKVPAALDSASALAQQFSAELLRYSGRNHLYQPQQQAAATTPQTGTTARASMCEWPVSLGMVDTDINAELPALSPQTGQFRLVPQRFLPEQLAPSYAHGTAVASLLAARDPTITPLLPNLTLYSAAAFYASNAFQQSASLEHLLTALDWLASQPVQVINLSLTGPDNPVLALLIQQLQARGLSLVAAAGNGGPAAAPLYPAAYPGVIAVSAIDQQQQPYRWANRGNYVDFAALGVRIAALNANGQVQPQSGTSLAAPVVSAAVACWRAAQPDLSHQQVYERLMQQARDIGEPGKDPVTGYGVIEPPLEAQLN